MYHQGMYNAEHTRDYINTNALRVANMADRYIILSTGEFHSSLILIIMK